MSRLWFSVLTTVVMLLPASVHVDDAKDLKIIATAKETTRENEIGPILSNYRGLAVIRSAEYDKGYSMEPAQDPQGPKEGKLRIARGGAWSTQPA